MTSWLKKYKDVLPDDYTFHKIFIGKYVMPLELKYTQNFPQVPEKFIEVSETFPEVSDTFPEVSERFIEVPEKFIEYIPEAPEAAEAAEAAETFPEYIPEAAETFPEYIPEAAETFPEYIPEAAAAPEDVLAYSTPLETSAASAPLAIPALPMYVGAVRPVTAPYVFGTVQLIRYYRYRINRPSTR